LYDHEHPVPQEIPPGFEATVPEPVPVLEAVKVNMEDGTTVTVAVAEAVRLRESVQLKL
jgi:hypothetical protein